jgi:hypothetical protein
MDRPPRANPAEQLIAQKHDQYVRQSRRYRFLYYVTRLCAVIPAAVLPFVINGNPPVATALSVIVALSVAIDVVFEPKERWATYSKATDLLAIAELKRRGEYEPHREALEVVAQAEAAGLRTNKDIEEVLRRVDREDRHIGRQ